MDIIATDKDGQELAIGDRVKCNGYQYIVEDFLEDHLGVAIKVRADHTLWCAPEQITLNV